MNDRLAKRLFYWVPKIVTQVIGLSLLPIALGLELQCRLRAIGRGLTLLPFDLATVCILGMTAVSAFAEPLVCSVENRYSPMSFQEFVLQGTPSFPLFSNQELKEYYSPQELSDFEKVLSAVYLFPQDLDIDHLFLENLAVEDISSLAQEFFDAEGLSSAKESSEFKEALLGWQAFGVDPILLINTWQVTKLELADAEFISWLHETDSFSDEDLKASPSTLSKERKYHLIKEYKIEPLILEILTQRMILAMMAVWQEEGKVDLTESNLLHEKLLSYQKMQPPLVDLEDVQKQKEKILKEVKAQKKALLAFIPKMEENALVEFFKSFPRMMERALNLSLANIAYWDGKLWGAAFGKNWDWSDVGADIINFNREMMNNYGGGSYLGSDLEFANVAREKKFFGLNLEKTFGQEVEKFYAEHVNLELAAESFNVFEPVGRALAPIAQPILNYLYEKKKDYDLWVTGLTEKQYERALQEDRYLQLGQLGLDAALTSLELLAFRGTRISSQRLARLSKLKRATPSRIRFVKRQRTWRAFQPLIVAGVLGGASSLGAELYQVGENKKSFSFFRLLHQTNLSTEGSLIFMKMTQALSNLVARQGGFTPKAVEHAKVLSKSLDFTEGSLDIPGTIAMIKKARSNLGLLGSSLILGANIFDTTDVSVSGVLHSLKALIPGKSKAIPSEHVIPNELVIPSEHVIPNEHVIPSEARNPIDSADYNATLAKARLVLGQDIPDRLAELIYASHRVGYAEPGKDGSPACIGNYTDLQLIEKTKILTLAVEEGWITYPQLKKLIQEGVVGSQIAPIIRPGEMRIPPEIKKAIEEGEGKRDFIAYVTQIWGKKFKAAVTAKALSDAHQILNTYETMVKEPAILKDKKAEAALIEKVVALGKRRAPILDQTFVPQIERLYRESSIDDRFQPHHQWRMIDLLRQMDTAEAATSLVTLLSEERDDDMVQPFKRGLLRMKSAKAVIQTKAVTSSASQPVKDLAELYRKAEESPSGLLTQLQEALKQQKHSQDSFDTHEGWILVLRWSSDPNLVITAFLGHLPTADRSSMNRRHVRPLLMVLESFGKESAHFRTLAPALMEVLRKVVRNNRPWKKDLAFILVEIKALPRIPDYITRICLLIPEADQAQAWVEINKRRLGLKPGWTILNWHEHLNYHSQATHILGDYFELLDANLRSLFDQPKKRQSKEKKEPFFETDLLDNVFHQEDTVMPPETLVLIGDRQIPVLYEQDAMDEVGFDPHEYDPLWMAELFDDDVIVRQRAALRLHGYIIRWRIRYVLSKEAEGQEEQFESARALLQFTEADTRYAFLPNTLKDIIEELTDFEIITDVLANPSEDPSVRLDVARAALILLSP
ncbi:MAG: hypothetical protein HY390_03870, partial [Deltaproteobacteria bacterium]|nr:hypothetical protein [Deltaproteobacteria bacterium]